MWPQPASTLCANKSRRLSWRTFIPESVTADNFLSVASGPLSYALAVVLSQRLPAEMAAGSHTESHILIGWLAPPGTTA